MDTFIFITHSPLETEAVGEQLGRMVRAGCVIGLSGDLGAGKTQFVKGVARALGATERVHSPTFALINVYSSGRLPLYHLDLYRLETQQQIDDAGLDEYFLPDGVAIVEWVERWKRTRPDCYYSVRIEVIDETDRQIQYEYFGP
jgi:tRNA threonylcarbamoyladenosine biosynthesis protein TsaE